AHLGQRADEANEVRRQLAEHVTEWIAGPAGAAARQLAVRRAAHPDVVVDVDRAARQVLAPEPREIERRVADVAQLAPPLGQRRLGRREHAERQRLIPYLVGRIARE